LKLLVGLIGILRSTGSKSANGLLLKPGKKLLSRQKGISRSLRIEDSAFITRSDQINLKIALERHSASHHLTTKKAGSNAPFVRRNTQPKEKRMTIDNSRRSALLGLGALAVGAAAVATGRSRAATTDEIIPPGARELAELTERLRRAPRRRDFKTVPMILERPDFWDDEALKETIAYQGARKQVWDNTDIAGPWLNLMRNSINAQIFSFGHRDFLAVSATHGTAHLALLDQAMWDKYDLAALAGGKFKTNTLATPKRAATDFAQSEDPKSVFGSDGDDIPALQERGVVFLGCHNAIWEVTGRLIASDKNPDHASHKAVAAELTNHLIDGVVLTPGIVATIPELQQVGFHYAA
jgi:hypothetical protein